MAYNRHILIEESSLDYALDHLGEEVVEEVDDFFLEEVPEFSLEAIWTRPVTSEDQEREIVYEAAAVSADRIEITQQQLSRVAALVVIAGFLVFLVGYSLGTYKAVGISEGSEFIPTELYSAFFKVGERDEAVAEESLNEGKAYGRFATRQEADKLREEYTDKGQRMNVIPRVSKTASGQEYRWYTVVDELVEQKNDLCMKG